LKNLDIEKSGYSTSGTIPIHCSLKFKGEVSLR